MGENEGEKDLSSPERKQHEGSRSAQFKKPQSVSLVHKLNPSDARNAE